MGLFFEIQTKDFWYIVSKENFKGDKEEHYV